MNAHGTTSAAGYAETPAGAGRGRNADAVSACAAPAGGCPRSSQAADSAPAESPATNEKQSDAATADDDSFPLDQPPALPAKQVAVISLREQADAAHEELTRRHRSYAGQVKHGRMTEAEAAAGIAVARAIRNTLRLLAEHENAVRECLRREIAARKLANHPAVGALREAFPDAEVASVRPLYQHTEDPQI